MTDAVARLSAALSGRYAVVRELGAGGMATVYLAHDVRHDRKVALKVLRPELAAILGADRFLAEIKTTANLQHPHILSLFDSGESDGVVFYVMPYVEGESLRDRLQREHQLPIDDALRIAREVGDALEYAHGHGIIHRDIKPENILLQGGHAMVADFGIALAAARTGSTRMTETGMSLGTPTYMSPEQAMGERTLDARSDIYALGCVLYEMLAGEAPFNGPTAQAIVAKVLTAKPAPLIARRPRVTPQVEDAVLTALEKLPADRFASAAEFVAALQGEAVTSAVTARAAARRDTRPLARNRLIAGVALIATLAGLSGWLVARARPASTMPAPSRLAIVESGTAIAFNGVARTIDISADGQLIAYVASHPQGDRVQTRRLDGSASQLVPNSTNAAHLRISPDGRFLYASMLGSSMQRLPLSGGVWAPVAGLEVTSFLAFGDTGTLWWASMLAYGSHRRSRDGGDTLMFPRTSLTQVLPDGRHAVGVGITTGSNSGVAQWMDLRTGDVTSLFDAPIVEVRYTMGYLVYVRPDGVMVAVPFDAARGRVTGAHVEIAADVSVSGAGLAQYGVADNGTIAFIPGFSNSLVRVSRDGSMRVLLDERRRYHSPRISPDGRRVSFDDVSPEGRDVWIHAVGTSGVTRATFQRDGHDAVWTLDGRGLYYLAGSQGRLDIFRTVLGTTVRPQAESIGIEATYTGTPLRNGAGFLTTTPGAGRGLDIVRLAPRGAPIDTVLATTSDESFVVPSPDGRWFAYTSDHSGRQELYLRSLDGGDVQLQVSLDGASEPVWARDGREIYYRRPSATGAELVAATLQLGIEPTVVKRTRLFDVSGFDTAIPHANYDVAPDGNWFVFARRGNSDHIVVLQNVPELARRAARAAGSSP